MKIIYSETALSYVEELTDILHERGYFIFKESAKKYVDKLIDNMEATIHIKPRRDASPHFDQYGTGLQYVSYRKNKRTTWYFFFNHYQEKDIYYIRYITNNHVAGHLL